LNRELEFFYLPTEFGGDPTDELGILMHETTHVVNATTSWHRAIINTDGTVAYDTDLAFTEWDGDGTAIVDLDTGVDAGHPDYDYLQPWSGEKTLYSAKWDGVWTETRNSDTSSGHGTHVGGTIAGNGDASAGRRAGVAKGGQLVALGTGDGASIFAAEQGLEWTYQHSIPGQNEYHIRVVSNSWGTDGDYDPNGAVAQLTDMLTYDHGVAVIFAASNSGGNGGECAGGLKTNVYAKYPIRHFRRSPNTRWFCCDLLFLTWLYESNAHLARCRRTRSRYLGHCTSWNSNRCINRNYRAICTICPYPVPAWLRLTLAALQVCCSMPHRLWALQTTTVTTTTRVTPWSVATVQQHTVSSMTGIRQTIREFMNSNSSSN
jgi:subtilisin family serine protease